MIDRQVQAFKEEAGELLADLESALLELEKEPLDRNLLARAFRALHTIKGMGGMFGFDDVSAFVHEVETALDLVRNGSIPVTKPLVDLVLDSRDQIKAMLDASEFTPGADPAVTQEILIALRTLAPRGAEPARRVQKPQQGEGPEITYRIRFAPERDLFAEGSDPMFLLNKVRKIGPCTVAAQTTSVPDLEEIDPEGCYLQWEVIVTTAKGEDAIRDIFFYVEEKSELSITAVAGAEELDPDGGGRKIGEILLERGDIGAAEVREVLGQQSKFGEIAVAEGLVSEQGVRSALAEQQHQKEAHREKQRQEAGTSIKVPAERLDALLNLVGEMVTAQARLSRTAARRDDDALTAIAEEVERLTGELRDRTLTIRMLPIGATFNRLNRLVRDLSSELGKEVELVTEGGETELDKTVIEKLNDPLVHLIRNSIDHGIEHPEHRVAAGKGRHGTVRVSAVHSGDRVIVTVQDDGAGLDKEAIRSKAILKGIIQPTAELSDQELYALIFAPGFSTADQVSSISGRGVGMDVVKKGVDGLNGSIEITNRRGEGSRFAVTIPLTLAIVDTLLVKIGSGFFLIPLSAVEECVELTPEDLEQSHGRNLTFVRGKTVPLIPLRERFVVLAEKPKIEQVVIVGVDGMRVGLVVDEVVGGHQTVIKPLDRHLGGGDGISGATILGDGRVGLILDVSQLVRSELCGSQPTAAPELVPGG